MWNAVTETRKLPEIQIKLYPILSGQVPQAYPFLST
jgi:hypothetical protein